MVDLSSDSILLLDGATGTELARRGVDVALPAWSARALLTAPDVVEQIHIDYLRAGADAITANTFRTHRRSLEKIGMGDRARELTRLAVDIARSARDKVKPEALVLGSVAPLEDCYRPDLAPLPDVCRAEHAEMIAALLDAEVDLVLIETANTRHEAAAAAQMAARLTSGRWMMSFCTKTAGPPGVLLHGAPIVDVLPLVDPVGRVGVETVDVPVVASHHDLQFVIVVDVQDRGRGEYTPPGVVRPLLGMQFSVQAVELAVVASEEYLVGGVASPLQLDIADGWGTEDSRGCRARAEGPQFGPPLIIGIKGPCPAAPCDTETGPGADYYL